MNSGSEIRNDNQYLNKGYNGRFESYGKLVKESTPDIIYLNGAPEDELEHRADWSLVHQKNLTDYGRITEQEIEFIGPEQEITSLESKLGIRNLSPTTPLDGKPNRLDEYQELSDYIEGDEEIHFIGSDYTTKQDQVIQRHTMPDIDSEFIGAETNKNTSTERLKRRLYAEALKLSDRF